MLPFPFGFHLIIGHITFRVVLSEHYIFPLTDLLAIKCRSSMYLKISTHVTYHSTMLTRFFLPQTALICVCFIVSINLLIICI